MINERIEQIEIDTKNFKITKIFTLLSEDVMKEVKTHFRTPNNYFLWNNVFFDNEVYNARTRSCHLNYIYSDLIGKEIYGHIALNNHKSIKVKLMDAKQTHDELIESLIKDYDVYKNILFETAMFYVNKKHELTDALHQKQITVFNTEVFEIFNQVIPKDYLLTISDYGWDGELSISAKSIKTNKRISIKQEIFNYYDEYLTIEKALQNISKEINRQMLREINKEIKKLYLSHHRFRHTEVVEKDNFNTSYQKPNVFDAHSIPFVYSLTDNVEDFYTKLDYTISSILYKEKVKACYYELLQLQSFFKDRPTKVKFINYIDNYLKEVKFTFDDKLVNHTTILPIYANHHYYDDAKEIFGQAYIEILKK